ncbi:hypothetical protein BDZ94DRAFT_377132 [Collybia nuda]|uniref:Protein kinase domain-containing protein n=1 Tax=Collybia nuda TaxID=64659 RepID=A0A9P5YIP7_9AGAR|nr:hypothetical protein BDZ94DRAFT_377132 [Collybia nuda]
MTVNENDTTTISMDYLRLLSAGFEWSLAAGNFTGLEWTETLAEEHRYMLDRICRTSDPWRFRHQKSDECTPEISQKNRFGQVARDRPGNPSPYGLTKEQFYAHTHCSIVEHERKSDKLSAIGNMVIKERARSCRHVATKFDDIVMQVINILRQPSGQFALMEDFAAQSLLDSLQTLIDHPQLEEQFKETLFSALLRIPRRSNIYPSNFSFDHIKLDKHLPVTSGGFADIYKVWWPHDNRAVCLKVYRKVGVSSSINTGIHRIANREAFIWRHLSHDNVVPFYGIHQFDDSRIALVLPWVKHGHIHHFLALNPDVDRSLLMWQVGCHTCIKTI